MKWLFRLTLCVAFLFPGMSNAQEEQAQEQKVADKPVKIVVMITEQNIGGPQRAWWASEIDLSIIESALAESLSEAGYEVVTPESLRPLMQEDPAFRVLRMRKCHVFELANSQAAQYVIKGKAVASRGSDVPQSSLRSYYASANARVIRVKDEVQVATLRVWGKSAHAEAVIGGSEALEDAGKRLSVKIIDALERRGAQ